MLRISQAIPSPPTIKYIKDRIHPSPTIPHPRPNTCRQVLTLSISPFVTPVQLCQQEPRLQWARRARSKHIEPRHHHSGTKAVWSVHQAIPEAFPRRQGRILLQAYDGLEERKSWEQAKAVASDAGENLWPTKLLTGGEEDWEPVPEGEEVPTEDAEPCRWGWALFMI